MKTRQIRIPTELLCWLKQIYDVPFQKEYGYNLSDSKLTEIAIRNHKSILENKQLEIKLNKKGKVQYYETDKDV